MPAPRPDVRAFILANPSMAPPAVAATCGVVIGTVYNARKQMRRDGVNLPNLGKGGRKPLDRSPEGAATTEFRLVINYATLARLRREATLRGEPVDGLMSRLLDVIAADRMVDAVLDDGGA